MKIIYTLISIVTVLACSNSRKSTETVQTEAVQSQLLSKEEVSLSFERTICFGTCPAYRIEVKNDGSCTYEGFKFTDKIGKHKATISKDQFQIIVDEANRIGYFSMQDVYDNEGVSDVPSVYIMICGPNGAKKVHDRFNSPTELKPFERFIDSILLKLDWKPE